MALKKAQGGTPPDTLYTKKTTKNGVRRNEFVVRHPDTSIEMGVEKKEKGKTTKKSEKSMLLGYKYTDDQIRASMNKKKSGGWIKKAADSIKRRGTAGKCTPITKPGCTGRAKALAKTFKKIAKNKKGK